MTRCPGHSFVAFLLGFGGPTPLCLLWKGDHAPAPRTSEQEEAEGLRLRGPRAAARAILTSGDPVSTPPGTPRLGRVPGFGLAAFLAWRQLFLRGQLTFLHAGVCMGPRAVTAGVLAAAGTFCPHTRAL